MNISFKNIQKFQGGGVSTVEWTYPNSSWYSRSGNDIIEGTYQRLKALHDKWKTTGRWDDYNAFVNEVNKMNNDQRYGYVPNYLRYSKNNTLFTDKSVGQWQGTIKNDYNYINDAIGKNYNQYHPVSPTPTSGDNQNRDWVVDNYWAGITQDRTPWGYADKDNPFYQYYKNKFAEIGIDYRTNNKDWEEDTGNALFGFLMNNPSPSTQTTQPNKTQTMPPNVGPNPLPQIDLKKSIDDYWKDRNPDGTLKKGNEIPEGRKEGGYGFDWKTLGEGLKKQFPNILEAGRLIGNYYNNEKVYGEQLKGIRPDLMQSYNTYRQVVGDEATKQAYYRRAAAGQTRAAQPFTSDADKQMAYRFEAERAGNELKAQGDLADNQRILETSEQSAQHADANRQRATEVANANLKSINYANSLKHNLLAQKHSANWTSFDNFLQGIGYRNLQKQREREAIENEIFTLTEAQNLAEDSEIRNARKALQEATKKHTDENGYIDTTDQEVINAQNELRNILYRKKTESLRRKLNSSSYYFVKSGGKITHKKKDDLLYKQVKDSVEHFRKMSKMSSDAQNRKRIKIEKLTPPPKTKKFQQGGVAPFTIYKPIILGEETTSSREYSTSSSSSKSSSSSDGKDSLDLVKKLFENLVGKGLPIDVNQIYVQMNNLIQKSKVFGTELSTEDIASMYLSALQQVNTIQYYKTLHDKAKERVDAKNANYEWAIDPVTGKIAVQNKKTGEVGLRKFEDIDLEVENPLTNQNLLDLRSKSPNLAFDDQTISIVSNATSMEEIAKFLKSQVPTIQSTETTLEGYTKKDTDLIKQGVRALLDAPDGDYKYSETYKSNSAQINKALAYVYSVLPQNMKTLLKTKGDPKKLIETMLGAGEIFEHKYELDAATNGSSSSSSSEDIEKIKSNPIMQMIQEQGGSPRNYQLITRDSNIQLSVDGTSYSQIPKITEDTSVAKMLTTSGFQAVADSMYGITFGDQNISPEYLKDIMYPNDGAMIVTLPCKTVNGHKEVNLGVIDSYKEAVNDVESKGLSKNSPEYRQELGKALQEKGLSNLLTADGYPDRNKFSQFLVFSGYTTDKIKSLDTSSQFIEKVKNPDSTLEDRMIKALSTDDKKTNYDLDIDYWLYGDDVYRGTVFIPLNNNLNAAINAYGDQINVKNARELENNKQNFDKASNMKPSNSNILYGTKTE